MPFYSLVGEWVYVLNCVVYNLRRDEDYLSRGS